MKLLNKIILIVFVLSRLSLSAQTIPPKTPLYWDVYEYCYVQQQDGNTNVYIPEAVLDSNIMWVKKNLLSYGYNMICMDGWGDVSQINQNGYRLSHSKNWVHNYSWWSNYIQSLGMKFGMYDDPLWIWVNYNDTTHKIVGTNIPVSSLIDTGEHAKFTWVQVNRPGAEQYIKGNVNYWASMGIKYLRVDFLSWYESGYDRNEGTVGPTNRPDSDYVKALKWMREACDSNGVFLSLVMPNLFNEAANEKKYGDMFRINSDCATGQWEMFSDADRGVQYPTWSQWANAFDGYTYWSMLSGRDSVKLDGDFIRINTFQSATEMRSVISAHVLAGGPLSIADEYNTIGNNIWVYQHPEMLALHNDGIVCRPLTNNPTNASSQTWTGQLSNGDWVVGFFNRETTNKFRSINFSSLGITGGAMVRDLWQHANLGVMDSISDSIPPHGCMILQLAQGGSSTCTGQTITFNTIPEMQYNSPAFTPTATASSGLPVTFEVAMGPATIVNNQVSLTGSPGTVYVIAEQSGDSTQCAALPIVQSFDVMGGHQAAMYIGATFTGWSPDIQMSLVNGVWVALNVAIPAGAQELKFANTNDWSGNDWGNDTGLAGIAQLTTGGKPNISFTMPANDTVAIYFDDISLKYSIGSPLASSPAISSVPGLNIFPNPAQTNLTVACSQLINRVSVTDITGRTVLDKLTHTSKAQVDVTNLPNGVYVVKVYNGNAFVWRTVIIQR